MLLVLIVDIINSALETIVNPISEEAHSLLSYGLLFLFSWMVELSFGYRIMVRITHVLVLFFLLILLHYLTPNLSIAVTLVLTLLSSIYFPIGRLFGPISYNNLASTLYTTPEEAKAFLAHIPIFYYLGSATLLLLGLIIISFPLTIEPNKNFCLFMFLFIIINVSYKPIKQIIKHRKIQVTAIAITPLRFLLEAYTISQAVAHDHKKINILLSIENNWQVNAANPRYKNYILVIGESVRKDFMHAYGFHIPNTPFASTVPGVFFDNYLAAASSTVLSLSYTLAQHKKNEIQLQNNIITLAKNAGFYTYWLSNQDYMGEYDTPISCIGKHADCPQFIKILDPIKFRKSQDESLLPFIHSSLTESINSQPKLIIIHLLGSHPPCSHRTQEHFSTPFHSKQLSCYIQSIHNTDRLLSHIAEMASSTDNWSMLYFSDHGLALENGFFGHNDNYQESYRVPLFITSSDSNRRETISAYRSGLQFINLFAEWLDIQEISLKSERKYLSNNSYTGQTSVILANKKIISIHQLPTNKIHA